MKLRVFSVVGEALNFGVRRMETIMRVAWLPVVLILVLDMATVFAYLSVAAGRVFTFADVSSFQHAQFLLQQAAPMGWMQKPAAMLAVTLASVAAQLVLVASFSAPLIRLAGLGEAPAPGVFRLAFGPDQVRYLVAGFLSIAITAVLALLPAGLTAFFVFNYVADALSQTYAAFPDPGSLHTVDIVSAGEVLAERGELWLYSLAIPFAAAAPFALLLWAVLFLHFRPQAGAGERRPVLRALATLAGGGALAGGVWALLLSAYKQGPASDMSAVYAFLALIVVLALYVNLRFFHYPGVAVCRRSLGPGPVLPATRGWNILRLLLALFFIGAATVLIQLAINILAFPAIAATINYLLAATESYTRLMDGETGAWARPLFIWIWNAVKILYNIFWLFFAYGVAAGLFGRLYRESARHDGDEAAERGRAVWRRP